MEIEFIVLGSGSGGNASLLRVDGVGLMIDGGLGPRQIGFRLRTHGLTWNDVDAMLLTHTHADHWQEPTLKQLLARKAALVCHAGHVDHLRTFSASFRDLNSEGLVRHFCEGTDTTVVDGAFRISPIRVSHDAPATFGFRISCPSNLVRPAWAMGHLSDLGLWDERHASHVAGVDLLALEFNHDVSMQRASGRPQPLIDRVLGDYGHLSNEQAAELLAAVVGGSPPDRLKNVVQLHLSRQCNRPYLAQQAAYRILSNWARPPRVQTADQDRPLRVRVVQPADCVKAEA